MRRLTALLAAASVLAALPAGAQDQPAAGGDLDAGKAFYTDHCRGCHAGLIAPTLRGVVGRKIAGVADFPGYSDALKAKNSEVWSEANLGVYLTLPSVFAPGTQMNDAVAVTDPAVRANLIAYLKTLPPPAT